MANTYSQIHFQIIFVVKFRRGLIQKEWKEELYKYLTVSIQKYGHKVLIINGVEDHVHLFIGFRPNFNLSDLVKELKVSSTKWINENNKCSVKFQWQEGYAVFSYSLSQIPTLIKYIQNQEKHHQKQDFISEYKEHLNRFEIEYKDEYLFHQPM